MLSAAKHLSAQRARPFAALRVTPKGNSKGDNQRNASGPFTIDLDLERPTQEGTDEHDKRKHADACEGGIDGNAPDNVGCNQQFQSEHDGSTQVQAQMSKCQRAIPQTNEVDNVAQERENASNYKHDDPYQLESRTDQFNRVFNIHLYTYPSWSVC